MTPAGDEVHEDQSVRRGRGRPRNPETDHRITVAAAELMLRRGYDKMTVDDVAARAGVGKATVYRRWPSKEDLAVAAMEAIYSSELPDPDTGTLEGDLIESFTKALAFVNSPQGEAYLRMSIAESIRDPRIAALYRASTDRAEETAARMYRRGIERGEVRPDIDIDIAVQWLGGIIGIRAITHRPLPQVGDVKALVKFAMDGIRA